MDNRKHMRTEKKTAVKNSFGRLLATGIFVLIQVAWLNIVANVKMITIYCVKMRLNWDRTV